MVGDKSVVGGYSEVTRSYLAENVWLHRNYAGDSIIGNNVLIGAGAVTANMRLDKKNVKSMVSGKLLDTNLAKFGCVIGDNCVVGVNCSIMPGVKIASGSKVMPGQVVRRDIR